MRFAALCLATTLFTACALLPGRSRNNSPNPNPGGGAPPSTAVFRTGDVFELRVSGMPLEDSQQFAQQYTVGGDGFVNIPLAGQVRAAGVTQSELERAIEAKLIEEKMATRPTATIVVAPRARIITIGGQVRAPQRMDWTPDMTLLTAIMAAGGPADFAGKKIKLNRAGTVTVYNKKQLEKNPKDDPKLLPGDLVEQL